MKTRENNEKLNMNIIEQGENELKKVVGGCDHMKRRGYYPGCPCPDCGTILEDSKKMRGECYVSICPSCGQEWPWLWE